MGVPRTAIPVPSGEVLIYSVERDYHRGPIEKEAIEQLDALRPHLARAALLSARLGMERARAATESLAMLGLPAAVLRRGGRLMTANALFDRLVPDVMQDRTDRLALASTAADPLFAQALAALDQGLITVEVRSVPIAAQDDRPPLIVHLVPIHGAARRPVRPRLGDRDGDARWCPRSPDRGGAARFVRPDAGARRVARGIGEGRTDRDHRRSIRHLPRDGAQPARGGAGERPG